MPRGPQPGRSEDRLAFSAHLEPLLQESKPATTFVFRVPFSAFFDARACHSYLSASIGSRFAALTAGNIPLTTPTSARMEVAISNIFGATTKVMSAASACLARAL